MSHLYGSRSYMSKFDMFPTAFQFNLDGEGQRRTTAGGIVSIFAVLASIYVTFINFFNYFQDRQPTVIVETQYQKGMAPIVATKKDFQLMLTLWDATSKAQQMIDLVSGLVMLNQFDTAKMNSSSPISIIGGFVPCTQNHSTQDLLTESMDQLKYYNITGFTCMNITDATFNLGGDLFAGRQAVAGGDVIFNTCSFDRNCRNQTLMSLVSRTYSMLVLDRFINISDVKGYTTFARNIFLDYYHGSLLTLEINVVENEITTDDNYISGLSPVQTTIFYTYDSIIATTSDLDSNKPNFLAEVRFKLNVPLKRIKITRTYPTLDAIIGAINALIAMIMVVAQNIAAFLNTGDLQYYLMKNLYYIQDPKSYDKTKSSFLKKDDKLSMIISCARDKTESDLLKVSNHLKPNPDDDKDIDIADHPQRVQDLNSYLKGKNFERKWLSWVCGCSLTEDPSVTYFYIGQALLSHDTNVINLLQKMINYEKMMELLFEDYQLEVIKAIHQRKIYKDMEINKELERMAQLYVIKNFETDQLNHLMRCYARCAKDFSRLGLKISKRVDLI